jgi:hypothetical protein
MAELSQVAQDALKAAFDAKVEAQQADDQEVQDKAAADAAQTKWTSSIQAERDAHMKHAQKAQDALTIIAGELGFQLPGPTPTPPPPPEPGPTPPT